MIGPLARRAANRTTRCHVRDALPRARHVAARTIECHPIVAGRFLDTQMNVGRHSDIEVTHFVQMSPDNELAVRFSPGNAPAVRISPANRG